MKPVALLLLGTSLFLLPGQEGRAEDPKDILWYGNSFTLATCCGGTRSVPNIFRDIVIAAGRPAPRNRDASQNGQSLQGHLTSNTAVITSGITAGEKWEHVVLQDYSTWPTHIGNLPQHLSSSLGLYNAVKAHSPSVVPVMYETWARGYGNSFYPGSFANPAAMQQELHDGYQASHDNINAAAGSDVAKVAWAGDAWEQGNWAANLYSASDLNYHASNRGSLLNAMVLYGTMYNDPTISDINLATVIGNLSAQGLTLADGAYLASLAESVLAPVPEPTTGMLVLLTLVSLTATRRRVGF
jgi:hypothetical protein